MPSNQPERTRFFSAWITKQSRGIEIGPMHNPTFSKLEGWNVKVLDHLSTDRLKQKYINDTNIGPDLVEKIEEVDYVWTGEKYPQITNLIGKFDYAVACHVIEHAEDLIDFFGNISSILHDGGKLFLAIPDRDLMFDFYRPLSTLGDIILANVSKGSYDLKSRVDEYHMQSVWRSQIAWGRDDDLISEDGSEMPEAQRKGGLKEAISSAIEDYQNQNEAYRDGHRWVFNQETFTSVSNALWQLQLSEFKVAAVKEGDGCEFLAVLEKTKIPSIDQITLQDETDLIGYRKNFARLRQITKNSNEIHKRQTAHTLSKIFKKLLPKRI